MFHFLGPSLRYIQVLIFDEASSHVISLSLSLSLCVSLLSLSLINIHTYIIVSKHEGARVINIKTLRLLDLYFSITFVEAEAATGAEYEVNMF